MENAVKVHITGAAAVIVSGIKLEDWKLAEKYAPEVLKIMDKSGEPVFKVMTAGGTGSMNKYGVVWGAYPNEDGNATVTILLDDKVEDKKAAVTDVIGSALLKVIDMEKSLPETIEKIHKQLKTIGSCITQI